MHKRSYSICAAFFILLLLTLSLSGCNSFRTPQGENPKLWVLMEDSTRDGYHLQAELVAEQMRQTHEGLTIELEILPIEETEREVRLKQLHTQIMSGNGPDVYLLPTGNTVTLKHGNGLSQDLSIQVQPLLYDVIQAMRSGIFADISAYYDADDALEKDSLNSTIMDAGLFDGARFVLPLRYNLPVLMTGAGFFVNARLDSLVEDALASGDTERLIGLRLTDYDSLFPLFFDYSNSRMLINGDDIASYLRLYQRYTAATKQARTDWFTAQREAFFERWPRERDVWEYSKTDSMWLDLSSFSSVHKYCCKLLYWNKSGLPVYQCDLAEALQSAAIGKMVGAQLSMYPLYGADGQLTADVTYYGAVGSSCPEPELAYEFLRQFLLEEYQWDIYRPRVDKSIVLKTNGLRWVTDPQSPGMIENSWPVRDKGSASYLWETIRYQVITSFNSFIVGSKSTSRKFQEESFVLTDEDIPALDFEIDAVRFPIVQQGENTLQSALARLNNDDGTPTDVDIGKLAQQVWTDLWWHLAEG